MANAKEPSIGTDGKFGEQTTQSVRSVEYIYDMAPEKRRKICAKLQQLKIWEELANQMGYSTEDIDVSDLCSLSSH